MAVNWSNDLELSFLECYQAEPVLWDIKLKDYKNKIKTHDAWMRISSILEIQVEELKKKKESLMSSYRSYRNRVNKSIKSGSSVEDVYKPIWFAYESMDSFLGDTLKCKKTINTESTSVNSDEEQEHETNKENLEGGQEDQSQPPNTPNDYNKKMRRRQNPSELVDAGNVVKEALATFQNTIQRNESAVPPPSSSQDDDCDLYGKLLAKKLRKMSDQKRLKLMHEIDGMFIRYQYEEPRLPLVQSNCSYNSNPSIRSRTLSTLIEPRPGTSSSTYSEPPMHYAPMITPQTSASNIIIQSNELISADNYPVLHILDQSTDGTDTNDGTTSNTELNSPNSANQKVNIIHRAFNLC